MGPNMREMKLKKNKKKKKKKKVLVNSFTHLHFQKENTEPENLQPAKEN